MDGIFWTKEKQKVSIRNVCLAYRSVVEVKINENGKKGKKQRVWQDEYGLVVLRTHRYGLGKVLSCILWTKTK